MDASAPTDTVRSIATFEPQRARSLTRRMFEQQRCEDRVAGVQPQLVVAPGDEQQLAQILKAANDAGLAVIPRGRRNETRLGKSAATR